jgi:pseudouridine synthase
MKSKAAMTLDRVLSRYGLASRTAAKQAIEAGRLKVNGRVRRDPNCWVKPGLDVLQLDGRRLKAAHKVYRGFYKPRGVITSHGDAARRKTVYDYLGKDSPWLFPVGRLDKDTSGLLLLTNDTKFGDFVSNPNSHILKTYIAKVNGLIGDELIERLNMGVEMKRGDRAQPVSVRRMENRGPYTWLEVVLTEGKNREVRRMIEAIGFKVLKLVRTRIGPLSLQGLQVGQWRDLSSAELSSLRRSQASRSS